MEKDIAIIGGGPGGYVAAIRAAQLGAKVCLVERDSLGGTCLNRGCIPTKALYKNAEVLNTLKHIDQFGIAIDVYSIDVNQMQSRKQAIVDQLVGGVAQLLKANEIEVINGNGVLKDKNTIEVTKEDGSKEEIQAKNIIIATGSKSFTPPIEGMDLEGVLTSEEILKFKEIPDNLVVIGGGVIGMEFTAIFNALGSKVTVVEFLPSILAQVDSDLTKRLTVSLKKKGIDIHTSTKVTKVEKVDGRLRVVAEGKKGEVAIDTDWVLVSTGRMPVVDGLNLEGAGIEFDRKGIKVDDNLETNVKGVYAIGDVNGKIMLAHAASHQGIQVVEHILKGIEPKEHSTVPNCIFIFPEISFAGMTEDELKAKNMEYKTSKFMFGANGKALALGQPEGMVKVISGEDDAIIGVHIMGPHASDLIHEAILAINKKMKPDDIASTIYAHPTLAEAFAEAVMGLKGEAIHMVRGR
jgi:dihydrolipoamide dehydrogenase